MSLESYQAENARLQHVNDMLRQDLFVAINALEVMRSRLETAPSQQTNVASVAKCEVIYINDKFAGLRPSDFVREACPEDHSRHQCHNIGCRCNQ